MNCLSVMNANEVKPLIYNTSNDLVKHLKKNLKCFKRLIKDNTSHEKYFPFVGLKRSQKLDKISHYIQSKGFNESIDGKITRLYKRLDSSETQTNNKRKFIEVFDLNEIFDENERLDFEEDGNKCLKTNHKSDVRNNRTTKVKTFNSNDRNGTKVETNGLSNGLTNGLSNGLSNGKSVLNGNEFSVKNFNFKIPKKDSKDIVSIVSQAIDYKNQKRFVDAFNHLVRYLNDSQWENKNVLEVLANIAKGMVLSNNFENNLSKFNELMDKMKSLKYIVDDFWETLIMSVQKRNDNKRSHSTQINAFLSGLHDYLMENKVCAKVSVNEAVIIAFRIHTNHITAKDLIDFKEEFKMDF